MSKKPKEINEILFKLLSLKGIDGQKKLALIYNHDTINKTSLDAFGKILLENIETIYIIDINQSILIGEPILEILTISNKNDFLNNVKILSPKNFLPELNEVFSILFSSITMVRDQMLDLSKAFASIKYCNNTKNTDISEGNLIIANDNSGIAHIVFNTIKGDTAQLSPNEVEKVGNSLMEIVISNIDTDIENEEALLKIKSDIEYKIVEALPNRMKAGNININMDAIINEIQKIQKKGFLDDEDDNEEKEPV